jgi:hypothetical protein
MIFDFWCRSLWDWVLDLVENQSLARHFEWDAQKLYKYDGKKFIRFIHEPWTAARFWEVQVSMAPSLAGQYPTHQSTSVTTPKPGRKTNCYHSLCRQDKAVVVWNRNGLSYNCSIRKPSRRDSEWKRRWWGLRCWMATYCMLVPFIYLLF